MFDLAAGGSCVELLCAAGQPVAACAVLCSLHSQGFWASGWAEAVQSMRLGGQQLGPVGVACLSPRAHLRLSRGLLGVCCRGGIHVFIHQLTCSTGLIYLWAAGHRPLSGRCGKIVAVKKPWLSHDGLCRC